MVWPALPSLLTPLGYWEHFTHVDTEEEDDKEKKGEEEEQRENREKAFKESKTGFKRTLELALVADGGSVVRDDKTEDALPERSIDDDNYYFEEGNEDYQEGFAMQHHSRQHHASKAHHTRSHQHGRAHHNRHSHNHHLHHRHHQQHMHQKEQQKAAQGGGHGDGGGGGGGGIQIQGEEEHEPGKFEEITGLAIQGEG